MAIVLNGTTGITTPDIDSTAGFDAADITGTISTAQIADANVTQAKLAGEAVNEAKMQVSNAPTNGYMLTAQSGDTGGLTWAAAPTSSTTYGDVGTYVLGRTAFTGAAQAQLVAGTTYAGNTLYPAGFSCEDGNNEGEYGGGAAVYAGASNASALSGTWRSKGTTTQLASYKENPVTVFVRTA